MRRMPAIRVTIFPPTTHTPPRKTVAVSDCWPEGIDWVGEDIPDLLVLRVVLRAYCHQLKCNEDIHRLFYAVLHSESVGLGVAMMNFP